MSKSKPKDKKNENAVIDIAQYDTQRKELLTANFTSKKFEERLSMITKENLRLIEEGRLNRRVYEQKIEELSIKNETNEKRLLELSGDKTKLQIDNSHRDSKIRLLEKQLFDEQQVRAKELEEYKKNVSFEISKYESQLMEYKHFMGVRDELALERANLHDQIQIERADKIREVADKEREKVQATDKLSEEMTKKMRAREKDMLSLKREELSTTTRLTILQNHQLTSELEYQSKQTEKLIFKNEEMQVKISVLDCDLQIHKEVEEELAKRAHLSKGMIKKLNARVSELEQEVDELRRTALSKSSLLPSQEHSDAQNRNEMMIAALGENLESAERKYAEVGSRYEILLKEKEEMHFRLTRFESSNNKLGMMLLRYFYEILSGKLTDADQHIMVNFNHLNNKEVEDWNNEDLSSVVRILLTVIKPLLTRTTLPIPYIRQNVHVLEDSHSCNQRVSTKLLRLPDSSQKKQLRSVINSEDRYKTSRNRIQDLPVSVASKIVTSNLREWGKTVDFSRNKLTRKFKISESYRG